MTHTEKKPTTIGIDLAKNIFHLYALDERGNTLWKKAMRPHNAIITLQSLQPCIIGIEACGGSNYWYRTFSQLGHEVRMVTPQRAKTFREGQKNDENDANAIAQAVMHPQTRLVASKSLEQQEISTLHAMRNLQIRQRTQLINHLRGTLNEYGRTCKKGAVWFENHIEEILQEEIQKKSLPNKVIQGLLIQIAMLKSYRNQIIQLDKELAAVSQSDICQRLKTIPGVGVIVGTMLYAQGGNVAHYPKSSDFAASLGLVPRQHSTGGKQVNGSISKRGNIGLRANLIHGARSVLSSANKKRKTGESTGNALIDWGLQCYDRMGMNRACVAFANKVSRISWKIMKTPGEVFLPSMTQTEA
jgi:transposase